MKAVLICGRCYDEVDAVFTTNCKEKPEILVGVPIGQYHCPDCGAMIIAGVAHPDLCQRCLDRKHPRFDAPPQPETYYSHEGYPTEAALERIEKWDYQNGWHDFMEFVGSIWWYAEWGWRKEEKMDEIHDRLVEAYNISTAGWSGNESIIDAMKKNWMFWTMCWVESRRGGHFTFYVAKP